MQPHESWWENNADQDAKLRAWLEQSGDDRDHIGAIADHAGIASVLECGPGLFIDHDRVWASRPSIAYNALEVTPRFVAAGRDRGLVVYEGSIEGSGLADASFDLVYCRDVLEHLPHWKVALDEMLRVARKTVAVRFFRLSPSAQDDITAFDTVNEARGLHHNTYAQAGIEAHLRLRDAGDWEWLDYRPNPTDPTFGSCWLIIGLWPRRG